MASSSYAKLIIFNIVIRTRTLPRSGAAVSAAVDNLIFVEGSEFASGSGWHKETDSFFFLLKIILKTGCCIFAFELYF